MTRSLLTLVPRPRCVVPSHSWVIASSAPLNEADDESTGAIALLTESKAASISASRVEALASVSLANDAAAPAVLLSSDGSAIAPDDGLRTECCSTLRLASFISC